jgi:hypothetical protein
VVEGARSLEGEGHLEAADAELGDAVVEELLSRRLRGHRIGAEQQIRKARHRSSIVVAQRTRDLDPSDVRQVAAGTL